MGKKSSENFKFLKIKTYLVLTNFIECIKIIKNLLK